MIGRSRRLCCRGSSRFIETLVQTDVDSRVIGSAKGDCLDNRRLLGYRAPLPGGCSGRARPAVRTSSTRTRSRVLAHADGCWLPRCQCVDRRGPSHRRLAPEHPASWCGHARDLSATRHLAPPRGETPVVAAGAEEGSSLASAWAQTRESNAEGAPELGHRLNSSMRRAAGVAALARTAQLARRRTGWPAHRR